QLGVVVRGEQRGVAEADDAEGPRDGLATRLGIRGRVEDREQPVGRGQRGRVTGAGVNGPCPLEGGAQGGEIEIVLERRELRGDERARRARAEHGAAGEENAEERQPGPAHAAYTDWAAASAAPGDTRRPSARSVSSSPSSATRRSASRSA